MDKSAVDAIIAQAMDACALDHIAKLNTVHLSDSSLPSDLESRFRKLKSFPAKTTASPTGITSTRSFNIGKEKNTPPAPPPSEPILPSTFTGSDNKATASTSPVAPCEQGEMPVETLREIEAGSGVRAVEEVRSKKPSSPDFDLGSGFSPIKRRDLSPDQSQDRVGCCFFLSPKRSPVTTPKSRRKYDGRAFRNMDLGEEKELDDIGKFCASLKEDQRKLKKALEKQEKVRKEAAKLVRMAEDASDRMRAYTDELLSDMDEDELGGTHFH